MKTKRAITGLIGAAIIIGTAISAQAVCLIDCEPNPASTIESEGASDDRPMAQAQAAGRGNFAVGGIQDSVVLNGVTMHSENHVEVGSNSGEINTTATAVIMGVDKSHGNSTNSNTTSNKNQR